MRARTLVVLVVVSLAAACGGDDDEATPATTTTVVVDTTTTTTEPDASTTTTTAAPAEPFTILVSNDDGYAAEGIDALVEALRADPTIEVVVVAPAEDQSGSGDATTPGPLEATEQTTISGYPAVAVAGEPADSVVHALDVVFAGTVPDLVVSGINHGQNLGPFVDISGTVGAARIAARRGIPAVAVSQGLAGEGGTFDFDAGVAAVLEWLGEHRDDLEASSLVNINVPSCGPGTEVRGTVEVASDATADPTLALGVADCASTVTDPATDVAAFNAGFVALSEPGLGE